MLNFALNPCESIDPNKIVVSIAIDADNPEIQYEALRLIKSLSLFGGNLHKSKLSVCISHTGLFENSFLLEKLEIFNISSIYFSKRFSPPDYSPSLNKLCAFNPLIMELNDYLLYLDADIYVASDPLPLLEEYSSNIQCGRPWTSSVLNVEEFVSFVGPTYYDIIAHRGLLETIQPGGITLQGFCNTGKSRYLYGYN